MARPPITMSTCSIMYVIGRQRDDSLTQLTPEAILSQMTCRHQDHTASFWLSFQLSPKKKRCIQGQGHLKWMRYPFGISCFFIRAKYNLEMFCLQSHHHCIFTTGCRELRLIFISDFLAIFWGGEGSGGYFLYAWQPDTGTLRHILPHLPNNCEGYSRVPITRSSFSTWHWHKDSCEFDI